MQKQREWEKGGEQERWFLFVAVVVVVDFSGLVTFLSAAAAFAASASVAGKPESVAFGMHRLIHFHTFNRKKKPNSTLLNNNLLRNYVHCTIEISLSLKMIFWRNTAFEVRRWCSTWDFVVLQHEKHRWCSFFCELCVIWCVAMTLVKTKIHQYV